MTRQWTARSGLVATAMSVTAALPAAAFAEPAALPAAAQAAQAAQCGYFNPTGAPVAPDADWAQRWLGLPRVHAIQTGAGVRIAVVDTGVDIAHPQLRAAVGGGWDVPTNRPGGTQDCDNGGHGTAVASLIAARPVTGSGLLGVAPAATILAIRVGDSGPGQITPDTVAAGIRAATAQGARIIDISFAFTVDAPALRAAVAEAVQRDIVVVAAAGDGLTGATFPAGYDGVLGVGALAATGAVLTSSTAGDQVDLVAPGENVVAAARLYGHTTLTSTSAAAALVSGSAALLRAARPTWTAPQVAQRLVATADGTPGGAHSRAYGFGCVNPYRALTEEAAAVGVTPTWVPAPKDLHNAPVQPGWPLPWRRSVAWATVLLGAALAVGAGTAVALAHRHRHRGQAT